MSRFVVTLTCTDRPGIVHALTHGLLELQANIEQSSQFGDAQSGRFFLRMEVEAATQDPSEVADRIRRTTREFDAVTQVALTSTRRRVLVMVSKHDHCLIDLLYRAQTGELPIEVVGIISNHETCSVIASKYGIPYEVVAATPKTRAHAEGRLLKLVDDLQPEFIVLARYMQILSDPLTSALKGRVINIHHSFLPGFKGARPYHQAHDRGVKLIGATAHYVTGDLDEGPIIEQDVVRVSHAESVEELIAIGREVECRVLASAVRSHSQHKVFLNGSKTVVFR